MEDEPTLEIPLGGKLAKEKGLTALIDLSDAKEVLKHRWTAWANKSNNIYAVQGASRNERYLRMHRLIMRATDDQEIDHINGNGLDNRKSNLRVVTRSQNQQNRRAARTKDHPYKGVYQDPNTGRYAVLIILDGRRKHLGTYDQIEHAGWVYDYEAVIFHGPYAKTNAMMGLPTEPPPTKYHHISYNKRLGKWIAYIGSRNKRRHLGVFDTAKEAALAYNAAAWAEKGKWAKLNYIED